MLTGFSGADLRSFYLPDSHGAGCESSDTSGELIYSGSSGYSGQSSRSSKVDLHIQATPHQTLDLSSSLKIETARNTVGDSLGQG